MNQMIHETRMVMNRRHDREIRERAEGILELMGAHCDRGGCSNHSGHEFCSMDAAWEHAIRRAEDELYDRQKAEKCALSEGAA